MGGPELDCNRIIAAHAHGKPCQPEIFRHFGEEGEMRGGVVVRRRDAHQSLDLEPVFGAALVEKRRDLLRRIAAQGYAPAVRLLSACFIDEVQDLLPVREGRLGTRSRIRFEYPVGDRLQSV